MIVCTRMRPPAYRARRLLLCLTLTAWSTTVACTDAATEPAVVAEAMAAAPTARIDEPSFAQLAAAVDDARTRILATRPERGATVLAAALADLSQALQQTDAQAAYDAQRAAEDALNTLLHAAPEADADLAVIGLALDQTAAALQPPATR